MRALTFYDVISTRCLGRPVRVSRNECRYLQRFPFSILGYARNVLSLLHEDFSRGMQAAIRRLIREVMATNLVRLATGFLFSLVGSLGIKSLRG